jgi:small subunit ribosomal protein S6
VSARALATASLERKGPILNRLYEGMFLLDNQVVREDWKSAKALVAEALQKHGAKLRTLRRWEERKLAYPIQGRKRATYFLGYFEIAVAELPALRRDLDLSEKVLRHLILSCEAVPESENELAAAEMAEGYTIPPPPPDDAPEPKREEERPPFEDTIEVPDLNDLEEVR